jgi:ABC-type multidrug transport system ATPase subunit
MESVMAAAAEDGISVVLSSHVLAELERVADYVIVLSHGTVQVAGEVGDLLARHPGAGLEQIVLGYLREPVTPAGPGPAGTGVPA